MYGFQMITGGKNKSTSCTSSLPIDGIVDQQCLRILDLAKLRESIITCAHIVVIL